MIPIIGKTGFGQRLRARPGTFRRDEHAAALIEFALIAAPLLALLLAIVETSLVFFAQQGIETAAEAAARQVLTGQASSTAGTSSYMTQQQFHDMACGGLPPFLSCNNLIVDVQTVASGDWSDVNTSLPTLTYDKNGKPVTAYSTGSAGSIVVLRLMYIWPVPTGPLGFNLSNMSNNSRMLLGTEVFKSENYQATTL